MATTTPNFGWSVPTSSDLVKNGATAIETLGDSIDASLVDLKGGTTNQVLAKNSNTDMDFKWVADASGIPATIIDAKGDLIAGTAADTAARLAVGTNGQVLTADSAEATGLKWAAAAGGTSLPTFRATRITSDYNIPSANTFTKVPFNGEDWDTGGCYDSTTNFRFTPTTAGYYQINSNCSMIIDSLSRIIWSVYKNGSAYARIFDGTPPATSFNIVGSVQMYFNGTTDYAEMFIWTAAASTRTMVMTASYVGNTFDGVGIRS
jgi:hypothetical protein